MVLQGSGDHLTGQGSQAQPAEVQPAQAQPPPATDIVKEVHLTPEEWDRIEVLMHWACKTGHIKVDQSLCSKQCSSCTVLDLEIWIRWSTACAEWMIKQTLLVKKGFR